MLAASQRQAFTEDSPILAQFGDELSDSVRNSFADGIEAAIRSGDVESALQVFGNSMMDAVINSVAEGLAASLVSEVGLDDITGLLSGIGGSPKAGG